MSEGGKKMLDDREAVGILGQWVGMLLCAIGVTAEIALGGDWYFAVITAGSIVWAVATKIRHSGGDADSDMI